LTGTNTGLPRYPSGGGMAEGLNKSGNRAGATPRGQVGTSTFFKVERYPTSYYAF
jgi:hypothetical protein